MKKKNIKIDDSLIISRLQHKELLGSKFDVEFDSLFYPLTTESFIRPFFDNNPIKVGLIIKLIGNNIIYLHVDRGYFHHNVEDLLSTLSLPEAISAIGRLHYKTPIFYQIALLMAWQKLYDENSETKHYAKALEFSRISHHLMVIRKIFYCLKHYQLSDLINEAYEILAEPFLITERIYDHDASIEDISLLTVQQAVIDALSLMRDIHHRITEQEHLQISLAKKAYIGLRLAAAMGLTGPYLRANRCYYDLRHIEPSRHLYERPPELSVADGGDAWARFSLRLLEITASLSWLRTTLARDSSKSFKPIRVKGFDLSLKNHYSMVSIDSPEGDVKISIFVNEATKSRIFRLRTPAYFIAQSLAQMLTDTNILDVTLILNSLGITAEEIDK